MKLNERPTPQVDANAMYGPADSYWEKRQFVTASFARNLEQQRDAAISERNLAWCRENILRNQVGALMVALSDLQEDVSGRFDIESPSTNPGMRNCVNRAREILAATKPQK